MGFETSRGDKIERRMGSYRHKRSASSDPQRNTKEDHVSFSRGEDFDLQKPGVARANGAQKKPVNDKEIQSSLSNEILQLEERLQDQFLMRRVLEKALGYRNPALETAKDFTMPKPTKELIREISVLELEVMYLERYLLSLYRKAYEQVFTPSTPLEEKHVPTLSKLEMFGAPTGEENQAASAKPKHDTYHKNSQTRMPVNHEKPLDTSRRLKVNTPSKSSATRCTEMFSGPGVCRSHSELSQRAVCSAMASLQDAGFTGFFANLNGPGVCHSHSALSQGAVCSALLTSMDECIDKSMFTCHSEPLSFVEEGQSATSQVISLAQFLGTRIADHVPETPNRISEDMVRCMGSIYCKLAEPPLAYPVTSSSPASSFSSLSAISPQYVEDMWSPGCKKETPFESRLENPYRLKGLKEFSGPYNALIEVASICTDTQRLKEVEDLLKTFKSLAQRLERVDVKKMRHDEKLAFWINVHNALAMHVHVEYGIPQNHLRRITMVQKATCRIGGRVVSLNTIRSYILSHRIQYPNQWVQALLSPKLKLRGRDDWQSYAVECAEPLLHFALCSGSHSDPAVRIYTPKRVYKMLENAKEEYIRATISVHKEEKILLPKLLESYARESNLTSTETMDMIQRYLPQTLQIAIQRCQVGRSNKCVEWVPHSSDFRYLLLRELRGPLLN